MLSARVKTNKVRPNAKATSVSGLANSVSPVNWLTIFTVTVVIASKGFRLSLAAAPAPITTIIVSPIARLAASRIAPTMPGRAAGMTTLRTVSDGVAPRPSEPSRRLCGTALMMSSDSDDTKGMTMIPITSPAVITDEELSPSPSGCAK